MALGAPELRLLTCAGPSAARAVLLWLTRDRKNCFRWKLVTLLFNQKIVVMLGARI